MTDSLRETPLGDEHRNLGARLTPFAGYTMPLQYSGVTEEHHAVRGGAGLFDVSHMGRLEVSGVRALERTDAVTTNATGRLAIGKALYSCCCNELGGVLDDLIVYRVAAERVLVICNASNREKISNHLMGRVDGPSSRVTDVTAATALLALQGPRAAQLLEVATGGGALTSLPTFGVAEGALFGQRCTVARTGYTGEDGFEIVCPAEAAVALWRGLLGLGAIPVGLGARDTLRLEARLALYGHELDESVNPYEAGLGWCVKLTDRSFLGRDALAQIKSAPLRRQLVGFMMRGRGIARHGYRLVDEAGQEVGQCTSGAPSPTLKENIGLGFVPPALSSPGSRLQVDCRGRLIGAEVVSTPFYRRASPGAGHL